MQPKTKDFYLQVARRTGGWEIYIFIPIAIAVTAATAIAALASTFRFNEEEVDTEN